jgi:membrane-associated phospholipid phosphatase
MAGTWHKWWLTSLVLLMGAVSTQTAQAQTEEQPPVLSTGQAFSFGGAALAFGASALLGADGGPPACAPCDLEALPWFDRFAVGVPDATAGRASDLLVLGLGGATLLETAIGEERRGSAVITLEAVAWTFAVTEVAKTLIRRERPVMYTDGALAAAAEFDNQRSMWSGHTSVAFALATGYVLNNPGQDLGPKIAAMFAAAGVGALRIVAHKHFLSDVVAGALVGTLGAIVVHEVRY